jgi:HlyD family secretion protein
MPEELRQTKKNHLHLFKIISVLLPLVLIAIVALRFRNQIQLFWQDVVLQKSQVDENILELSGRIEGYETDIGSKVGGKIQLITVREGDRVRRGEIIIKLEDDELQESLKGALARITVVAEQVNQAQLQISVLENEIEETQLSQLQAEDDATGRINAAKATVASTKAQLAQAQAQVKQLQAELSLAKKDRDRFENLYQDGVVSKRQFDEAQTKYDSLKETLQARIAFVEAVQEQVKIAEGNLTQSSATRLNSEISQVRIQRLQTQLQQAQAQLNSLKAEKQNAQAQYQEIEARLQDLEIVSPLDGIVLSRSAEVGEVIAVGKTILTVINPKEVYLRGYIPEEKIGAIKIGQSAQVFLDSAPDVPLSARVSAIDAEASFTPENIYFRDDRITQVFGLKLSIDNPQGLAKLGMPADAQIILNQKNTVP